MCIRDRRRITEAYRSSDAPGAPTVVQPAIVGINASFPPMNLDPITDSARSNLIDLGLNIDYMGTTRGSGKFYLLKEGHEIAQVTGVLNPGRNMVHAFEQLGSPHTAVRVPARMNYSVEIGFPNIPGTDRPRTPRQLLIEGIQLETIIFSLSGGTGQRITLPTALKTIPRTGVRPARPHLP